MSARPSLVNAGLDRYPARVLVVASGLSVQFGAALAAHLFARVGPSGAVSLRLVFAAVALGAWYLRRGGRPFAGLGRNDFGVAASFGIVLAVMNLSFYEAIARIPLGVAVTVEVVGPLVVALVGSRRRFDVLWAVLAAGGVALLAGPVGHHLDPVGLGLALLAGACWAAYILLSAATGRHFPEASGLAVAMVIGALVVLPVGLAHAGGQLFGRAVLGLGAAVAVLSSILPYTLELAALRRLSPRAFGILMSAEPAFAALAGLVALGQRLSAVEVMALGLVMVANVGSALADRAPLPALAEKAG